MFTGLIQAIGKIINLQPKGDEIRLQIQIHKGELTDFKLGESIAVNGTCLTVETFLDQSFSAYASAETMSKTNLGNLQVGSLVNLERALALGDRLGGHLVSGHVDCQGRVQNISKAGQSFIYRIQLPEEYALQVIPKGSVTLDGISLTVNNCGLDFLEVNIIPQTQQETTISGWQVGSKINLETDLIGKYVQRFINPWQEKQPATSSGNITEDFLREHGF